MLYLLIACTCVVYLWLHAPALLLLLGGLGLLWYVVIPIVITIPLWMLLALIWGGHGLEWLVQRLPDIPGLTQPFAWESRPWARLVRRGWLPVSLLAFVLLSVLAHAMLPR